MSYENSQLEIIEKEKRTINFTIIQENNKIHNKTIERSTVKVNGVT